MTDIGRFGDWKRRGRKLAVLTAYDAPTAEILQHQGADMILVGDSVGMTMLGYPSTTCVTMDEMIHHVKAVRRGAPKAFLVADMPLDGVRRGAAHALYSAKRFRDEGRCDAVKIEWRRDALEITDSLRRHHIPVMGHVGLVPQTAKKTSGFKVQGRTSRQAYAIMKQAKQFEEHGAFSMIIECVPWNVAKVITGELKIPTIGIGAGPYCDGQVLVFHDLVGLFTKFKPRFVKRYLDGAALFENAVRAYVTDVKQKRFPQMKHAFRMQDGEAL